MKKLSIKVIGILTVVLTILSFSSILADAKIYNADITYNEDTEYLMAETYIYIDPKYNLQEVLEASGYANNSFFKFKTDEKKHCIYHDYVMALSKEGEEQVINERIKATLAAANMGDAITDYDITFKKESYPDITSKKNTVLILNPLLMKILKQ